MKGKDFTSLEIYQLAEKIIIEVYKITQSFPKEEIYGITSQLRRAAISIALNIAESYGRYHFKNKISFLYNSRGSLLETKSTILISYKLGFLKEEEKNRLIEEVDNLGVKLNNYIQYLRKRATVAKQ